MVNSRQRCYVSGVAGRHPKSIEPGALLDHRECGWLSGPRDQRRAWRGAGCQEDGSEARSGRREARKGGERQPVINTCHHY